MNKKTKRIIINPEVKEKNKPLSKKSRTRLYNPHDGSTRASVQVHEDKRYKEKYKKKYLKTDRESLEE